MSRRRGSRPTVRRLRRTARAANRWVGNTSAIICLTALGVYLGTLASMGPAPSFGFRALWVRRHEADVQVLGLSLLVALGAAVVTIVVGTRRLIVLAGLAATGVASGIMFREELRLIVRTIARYSL